MNNFFILKIKNASVICCLLILSPIISFSENLVRNAGFEEKGTTNLITGWVVMPGQANTVKIDDKQLHSGKFSFSISHTNSTNYNGVYQRIAIKTNTMYTVSVWVKGKDIVLSEKANGVKLYIGKLTGKITGQMAATDTQKGTFDWKRVKASFPSGDQSLIILRLYLHKGVGSVWFDDVELTEDTPQSNTADVK
ncbi:MAG: hypothetical protein A2096_12490 [Spirochaetes bacterium GWF1_41_5]|nr:MAG: hypothetical protein A2096_12490 [Spirochaetes bacterium GWF1_41_5]HBE03901.1 hypothetical protein [Spirochaetia bacterium]